jgi:hypothetical protein
MMLTISPVVSPPLLLSSGPANSASCTALHAFPSVSLQSVYSMDAVVSSPAASTTFGVAKRRSSAFSSTAVALGWPCRYCAATPATSQLAPNARGTMLWYEVFVAALAPVMPAPSPPPGAHRSMQEEL